MPLPMQVSMPLALHLKCRDLDISWDEYLENRNSDIYVDGTDIESFAFVDQNSERLLATIQFGRILQIIYEHPDWSQTYGFFSQRYTKRNLLSNRSGRVLKYVPRISYSFSYLPPPTVNFNTDPSNIGLPADFVKQRIDATNNPVGRVGGPDTLNLSLGPALSVGIGPASYIDLIYSGCAPGETKSATSTTPIAKSHHDGRGRTAQEWRELWTIIADWVYEHQVATILAFEEGIMYKYLLTDRQRQRMDNIHYYGKKKVPRDLLWSECIWAADGIRDMFDQIVRNPTKFHGIEWEFLRMDVEVDVANAFLQRFGPRPETQVEMMRDLKNVVSLPDWAGVSLYQGVRADRLRSCPDTYRGADWEKWLLSIEGGCVVKVDTVFQLYGRLYY